MEPYCNANLCHIFREEQSNSVINNITVDRSDSIPVQRNEASGVAASMSVASGLVRSFSGNKPGPTGLRSSESGQKRSHSGLTPSNSGNYGDMSGDTMSPHTSAKEIEVNGFSRSSSLQRFLESRGEGDSQLLRGTSMPNQPAKKDTKLLHVRSLHVSTEKAGGSKPSKPPSLPRTPKPPPEIEATTVVPSGSSVQRYLDEMKRVTSGDHESTTVLKPLAE
mmetsp:Transcript_8369/g.15853  ORF Transcript_8369/g.15853 Transcript_8369/m.15853 type:complete len:221 (-) Transcript_8369:176-838(-)